LSPRRQLLNVREEAYQRWLRHEEQTEWVNKIECFIRHVLFGAFYVYYIYQFYKTLSITQGILFTIFVLNIDCCFFGINHVNTHAYMMIYDIQSMEEQNSFLPFAFWHHYRRPGVFSMYPCAYRMGMIGLMAHFYIDSICYATGVHPIVTYALMVAWLIDYTCHEYYHTAKYYSYNPLHARFVGIGLFFGFLEYFDIVNCEEHAVHHSHTLYNQEDTEMWIDFGLPGFKHLMEPVLDFVYLGMKKANTFLKTVTTRKENREWFVVFMETFDSSVLFAVSGFLQKRWFPELDDFEVPDIRLFSLGCTIIFIIECCTLPHLYGNRFANQKDQQSEKITSVTKHQYSRFFHED